jgi:hypothetical protein
MPLSKRPHRMLLSIPSLTFPGTIFPMKVGAGEFHATFYALRFMYHARMVSLLIGFVNEEVGLL